MTLFLEIAAFLAIPNDSNFLIPTFLDDLSSHLGARDMGHAELYLLAIINEQHFVESNFCFPFRSLGGGGPPWKLFNRDNASVTYDVLLTACLYDRDFGHNESAI